MAPTSLPPNVHVSSHPCLTAKLSQLRSKNTSAREVKLLVHEIALILGCEALAATVQAAPGPQVKPSSLEMRRSARHADRPPAINKNRTKHPSALNSYRAR